jgi:hypothetical protein
MVIETLLIYMILEWADLGYFAVCTFLAIWWRFTFEKFVLEKVREEEKPERYATTESGF